MWLYFLVVPALIAMFVVKKNRAGYYLISFILVSYMVFLMGFRGELVGVDTQAYYDIFYLANNAPNSAYIDKLEPLYVLLNKVVGTFGAAPVVIFVTSLFCLVSVFIFIHKYSLYPSLSWAVFLVYSFFLFHNVVRQSVAVAIILLAIPFLINRSFFRFLFMLCLASAFHYTAIVFAPAYFLNRALSVVLLVSVWAASMCFAIFSSLFFKSIQLIQHIIPDRYAGFLSDERVSMLGGGGLGVRLLVMQFIAAFFIYCLLIMKKNKERHVGSFFFIQMGLIAIILENVFYSVGLIDRLTIYFTIFVSIAFPSSIAIGV